MSERSGGYRTGGGGDGDAAWGGEASAARVRALRRSLGDTQAAFAERLGTSQQTVSEWERGASRPRRMARRLLSLVAEQSGAYDPSDGGEDGGGEDGAAAEEGGAPRADGGAPPGAA